MGFRPLIAASQFSGGRSSKDLKDHYTEVFRGPEARLSGSLSVRKWLADFEAIRTDNLKIGPSLQTAAR